MTEFAAMAAVRIERVTVRNPLDSFFPGYSSTGPTRNDAGEIGRGGAVRTTASHVFSAGCAKNFTAFFELGAALRGACGGCCREYAQGQQAQPLTLLLFYHLFRQEGRSRQAQWLITRCGKPNRSHLIHS